MQMVVSALKAPGDLPVPLVPVVTARLRVEFILKMQRLEAFPKSTIRIEKRLILPGGEIVVGSLRWI